MKKFKDKIKYLFDNFMTKNPFSQILGLAFFVLLIILAGSVLNSVIFQGSNVPEEMQGNFLDKMWWNFMRVIDPGTITGDEGEFMVLLMSLFSTIGGILIFSILIGFLSSKIVEKLDNLKKGRTKVIEDNHTVILGWSPKVFTIIRELICANENKRKNVIVIMSEKNASDMYDEIKSHIKEFKKTDVICRYGNPIDLVDLELVNLNSAKSIIILSDETEESDIKVIKTVLAITNNPGRKKGKYNIVTEITDIHNKSITEMVGGDEIEITFTNDLISRLIVQTSRQSGLSIVYNELLGFSGNEIYFIRDKDIKDMKFREVLYGYRDEIIIGYKSGTRLFLKPEPDYVLKESDELIVIAETDDLSRFSSRKPEFNDSAIKAKKSKLKTSPEKILIIGWNKELLFIIHEIDKYVKSGSKIIIAADIPDKKLINNLKSKCRRLTNVSLQFKSANYTNINTIRELTPENFNSIIILTDELKGKSSEEKDANTLITLLFLRDILNENNLKNKDIKIISEMISIKNKELVEIAHINDFIISSEIISMILAQISEQKRINDLYSEIFDAEGVEIYLKPVNQYIKTGKPVNFHTVIKAAFEAGKTAIGYKLRKYDFDKDKNFGIIINPPKEKPVTFSEEDLIIVIASD